jgi:hypothetical protein
VTWPSFRDINKQLTLCTDTALPLFSGTTGRVYGVAPIEYDNCVVKVVLFCTDAIQCPTTCSGVSYDDFHTEIMHARCASSAGVGPYVHRTFVVYHQDKITPNWGGIVMDQYELTLECFIKSHPTQFEWVDRVIDCIHVMATHGILLLDMKPTNIVVRGDGTNAMLIDYNSHYCVSNLITPRHAISDEIVVIIAIEIVMCMLLYNYIRDWTQVDAWPLVSYIRSKCGPNSASWGRAYDVLMVRSGEASAILCAYQPKNEQSLYITPWSFLMNMHKQIYKRPLVYVPAPVYDKKHNSGSCTPVENVYNTCQW